MTTNVISTWLSSVGYRQPDNDYRKHIERFRAWYRGEALKDFHNYTIYNGTKRLGLEYRRMGMAKTICEDYASLLLNEKVQISADNFKELTAILDDNRFLERGNRLLEWTFALGTGAFVEFLDADGNPAIDYIRGDMIYPLSWDGDKITECAFGSSQVFGSKKDSGEGYYVQVHERVPGGYQIRNVYLTDKGKEIAAPDGVLPVSDVSPMPLFQIIRPNTVNCIDPDSPMGMSIYGAAEEQLKAVDLIFDSYVNEFKLGKKRIMVPMSLSKIITQEDGTTRPLFDEKDTIFTVLQTKDGSDLDKPIEINFDLRIEEHDKALQRMLDMLSKKCGLGTGRYNFEADGLTAKTATEVISEDSDLYQSVKRNEKPLDRAISGMVKALAWLLNGTLDQPCTIEFDDSIFEDTNATIARNIKLVEAGLKTKKAAIMEIGHISEEEATARLEEIAKETTVALPNVQDMFSAGESV